MGQNEWVSKRKHPHRNTYTAMGKVPAILFKVIACYMDTGCTKTEVQQKLTGRDDNGAIRKGIENLLCKQIFVPHVGIGNGNMFRLFDELRSF